MDALDRPLDAIIKENTKPKAKKGKGNGKGGGGAKKPAKGGRGEELAKNRRRESGPAKNTQARH